MKRLWTLLIIVGCTTANAQEATPLVNRALDAVGGKAKLLKVFRMKEAFNFGEQVEPVDSKKRSTRTSVIELPARWEIGDKERGVEPAKDVVRAWTLDLLVDPKSKIETIPDLTDEETACAGLQISGSVTPAMKLYFDKQSHFLKRVDWRDDFYRFSDWREHDGLKYAAKSTIFKLKTGKPWFFHEVTGLERLKEIPPAKPKP